MSRKPTAVPPGGFYPHHLARPGPEKRAISQLVTSFLRSAPANPQKTIVQRLSLLVHAIAVQRWSRLSSQAVHTLCPRVDKLRAGSSPLAVGWQSLPTAETFTTLNASQNWSA
jgi:hypothetical protein